MGDECHAPGHRSARVHQEELDIEAFGSARFRDNRRLKAVESQLNLNEPAALFVIPHAETLCRPCGGLSKSIWDDRHSVERR